MADFGDVLLGSKGAGKAAGVASDLARAGNKLDEVADVAKVADAVNAAPVVKTSNAASVALVPNNNTLRQAGGVGFIDPADELYDAIRASAQQL